MSFIVLNTLLYLSVRHLLLLFSLLIPLHLELSIPYLERVPRVDVNWGEIETLGLFSAALFPHVEQKLPHIVVVFVSLNGKH